MITHITVIEHTVASNEEMAMLLKDRDVMLWQPRGLRHQLFWQIKTSPYQTYKGPWGPELIYWDQQRCPFVKATLSRSLEIQHHVIDLLFE